MAVSSTVIPLTVLEVSYGLGGKPSDAYKAAYLRKLRKQVLQRAQAEASGATPLAELPPAPSDADALITGEPIDKRIKSTAAHKPFCSQIQAGQSQGCLV